jgi:hypothetical protein
VYTIVVSDPGNMTGGDVEVSVDGRVTDGASLTLVDDGARHDVAIRPRPAHHGATQPVPAQHD